MDKEDLTNNIAQHHRKTGHDINWDSATCLTHSTDKDQRLTLESWFTNLQPNPLNHSRKLPAAYERLLQSEYCTANENTNWLWWIHDCHLLFHKNDYSDEFIDTNYNKQNKQNDDFELYVTKERFYKAFGTLPTKTPTNFDKYVTAT